MKSEALNFSRHLSLEFVVHLFLHNLCVLNSNRSDSFVVLDSYSVISHIIVSMFSGKNIIAVNIRKRRTY